MAYHELKLRQIVHNAGWLEYDPQEIWKHMQECIEVRNIHIYIYIFDYIIYYIIQLLVDCVQKSSDIGN